MSLRRSHIRLLTKLAQFGAVAALGALAIGASRPGAAPAAAAAVAVPNGFAQLPRGAHPLARPEFEIGRLDPQKHISNLSLVFKLSPEQEAARDTLARDVSDPSSPSYRHFLTPEEYASRFGAKPADIARAESWLRSQGLEVYPTRSRLGARVTFGGTAAQLESAFHTELHQYKVGEETHFAMSRAPSLPVDLASVVLGIHGTHDFYLKPLSVRAQAEAIGRGLTPDSQCPTGKLGTLCQSDAGAGKPPTLAEGIAPPDWNSIYNVNPLYTTGVGGKTLSGTGVTIAIVGTSTIAESDLDFFWNMYGVKNRPAINTIVVPNTGAGANQNSAIEAVLDTEQAGAIAPGATLNYVTVGKDDGNVDDATMYAIEENLGDILSESWGGCEAQWSPGDADIAQAYGSAASLLGMTYMASSGDQMATSCINFGVTGLWVNIPAAFPQVTSVGGTGFSMSPSALSFTGTSGTLTHVAAGYPTGQEAVWNEGNDPSVGVGGGGGGISVLFPRPYYQTQTTAPTCTQVGSFPVPGITASAMRQVPDISFTAASGQTQYPYFIECTIDLTIGPPDPTTGQPSGDCTPSVGFSAKEVQLVIPIGGTSASTPSFAGVVALAAQAAGGRLGSLNPLLYSLPSTVFHDVTLGDNEVKCTSGAKGDPGCPAGGLYGYKATTGFDCASGRGSLDATKFVTAVSALKPSTTTLAAVTSPLTVGTAVALSATVAGGASTPTGDVTFHFQSYLANGAPDLSWAVSTATLSGGTATATPTVAIPPGLVNSGKGVDLVAEYGGDSTHLGSVSPKVHVTFAPIGMCISPYDTQVALGGTKTLAVTGGTPPFKWYTKVDTTAGQLSDGGFDGTQITTDGGAGVLAAASVNSGYVVVNAIDNNGAEAFASVTVGSPTGTPPWDTDGGLAITCAPIPDAGPTSDAGSGSGSGAGSGSGSGATTNPSDGGNGSGSGGNGNNGGGSSGCGCTTAGAPVSALGAMGSFLVGLAFIARRRRSRR